MLTFPNISPTVFSFGPFQIRWYGLFYIISFFIGYIFLKKIIIKRRIKLTDKQYEELLFHIVLGVILGGRIGYVLFYNLFYYLSNPLSIFAVWQGGMSFHGGILGVIISGMIFMKRNKQSFMKLADSAMPLVAIGLGLGRLGNFINAELYGRITDKPWGMIFPNSDGLPRHPSQLYEFFLEGVILSIISFFILKKSSKDGTVFWSWIGLYGVFRFFVEFFREPDSHIGYIFKIFTMGQILSFVMIILSLIYIYKLLCKEKEFQ